MGRRRAATSTHGCDDARLQRTTATTPFLALPDELEKRKRAGNGLGILAVLRALEWRGKGAPDTAQ